MTKHLRLLILAALVALTLGAQRTRVELVKPTTPQQDSKPNSDKVPGVYALSGQFERVVVLRFKYQADLLAGIEKMVKEQKIRNAVFLSGIGSLRNYHVHSVSNRTFPSKNVFYKDPSAPADIVSINGYVIDGRVHAHMTLTDGDKAFGGHIEPDNSVFTFAIVTLGVFGNNVDLSKVDDKTYR
ncbi:MAG: PPC domain-containing DNA-binding protein [Bryobacteraceae bacterium]